MKGGPGFRAAFFVGLDRYRPVARKDSQPNTRSGMLTIVRSFLFFITICVSIATAFYAANRHDDRLWRDYKLVRAGYSAEKAKAILGEPSWQGPCGTKFNYGYKNNCIREIGYRSAYAPLNPLYWVVQLDKENKVLETNWIASP